jgi:spore coat polysaccharide biosynthesis protein SpsF
MKLPCDSNITALEQVVNRVKHSRIVEEVVIATSDESSDQPIVDLGKRINCHVFKGSLHNVLERFHSAATKYSFDIIVRITGDCPCIDPTIIDFVVENHIKENADFTSCSFKRTFPIGIDVGVMNLKALEKAFKNATSNYDKEHITSYFYNTKPNSFKIKLVEAPDDYRNPEIRLTLDTPEDYIFLCAIYDHLYSQNNLFELGEILTLLKKKSWMREINKQVVQKRSYSDISFELKDALEYCKKQDLVRIYNFLKEHSSDIQKKYS